MKDWTEHIGRKLTFFETEIDGRMIRVSANLRPREKGNIIWQLATKTKVGNHWSTSMIRLEDMRKLGFLLLALSMFCVKTRYMDKKALNGIMAFKEKWNNLVDRDFRSLKTKKALIGELKEKCGIS